MKNSILYATTVMIWGSTFLVIKYQLGSVDPMVSVAYRFGLAAALLMIFCRLRGLSLKFSIKEHMFMAVLGMLLFSVNYWLVYTAELYLTSGLVAIVFSSIVFMNIINGSLFLGTTMNKRVITGAVMGIFGIILIFMPEIQSFDFSDNGLLGLVVGLSAAFLASLGNITSARNTKKNIPIVQANAFGMAYGAILIAGLAFYLGKDFIFITSASYIGSLFYLAIFGSIIAFGSYLTLIGSIGADRAAYAIMLVPVVALVLSSFYEGYIWNSSAIAGLVLVLAGNFLALKKQKDLLSSSRIQDSLLTAK